MNDNPRNKTLAKDFTVGITKLKEELGWKINNSMPEYTVNLLEMEMNKLNKRMENSNTGILGVSYKKM